MMRAINFNAGPSRLPVPVLDALQEAVREYEGSGMSILEMSHRSKQVAAIVEETQSHIRELMGLRHDTCILFLQGGASMQFINVPLNFLHDNQTAAYINTGAWSKKAITEAKKFGDVAIPLSSENAHFNHIPDLGTLSLPDHCAYLHITSNNTIYGTQYHAFPRTEVPLVADMSSDILSRAIDTNRFDLIYAGAQKNLGPSGVTLVLIRASFLARARSHLPSMQDYKLQADKGSLYNTPPVFQILALRETARWLKTIGGIKKIEAMNREKSELLYGTIDAFADFYRTSVRRDSRSRMNVTFRLPSEDLESKFLEEAAKENFTGLKGHRNVGGIRVSMYNALLPEDLKVFLPFMEDFAKRH